MTGFGLRSGRLAAVRPAIGLTVGSAVRMHDEDGTVRASGNVSSNAAGNPAAKPGMAV
jgi:hypothetical protein